MTLHSPFTRFHSRGKAASEKSEAKRSTAAIFALHSPAFTRASLGFTHLHSSPHTPLGHAAPPGGARAARSGPWPSRQSGKRRMAGGWCGHE